MPQSKSLTVNIIANNIGVIGQILIAFFLSPFLVKTLGDTQYGIWTLVVALSGYMSLLDFGLSSGVTRYIANYQATNDRSSMNEVINSSLSMAFIISTLLIILSPLIANIVIQSFSLKDTSSSILHMLIIIVAFDMAVFIITGVFRGIFGGFQRFDIINIAQLLSALIKALAFYYYLSAGHGLITMGVISVVSNLLLVLIFYTIIQRKHSYIRFSLSFIRKEKVKLMFGYSKFIFLAMLSSQILSYSGSLVVAIFFGAAAVTWFSIPFTLVEYAKQFILALTRSYIPLFSKLDGENNTGEIYKNYLSGTKVVLIFSNLLCIGMIVFGDTFIAIWMGEYYALKAEFLIYIMFLALYFISPHLIAYALMQGLSIHQHYAKANLILSIVSIVLSVILAKIWGLEGVALGAAIPQIIFCGFMIPYYVAKKQSYSVKTFFKETHFKTLFPTLILWGILYILKVNYEPDGYLLLIVEAFIGTIFYLLFTYFIALNKTEKILALKLVKKIQRR